MLKIKFLATFVAVLFVSQFAMAQSSGSGNRSKSGQPSRELRGKEVVPTGLPSANEVMTDKQVVKFIKEEQKKGTPNSEIIAKLLLKGVTESQLIRIREEYLSSQGDVLLVEDEIKAVSRYPQEAARKASLLLLHIQWTRSTWLSPTLLNCLN